MENGCQWYVVVIIPYERFFEQFFSKHFKVGSAEV